MITSFTEALAYMESGLAGSIALLSASISIAGAGFMYAKGTPIGGVPFFVLSMFLTHYLYGLIGQGDAGFISGLDVIYILAILISIVLELIKGGRR